MTIFSDDFESGNFSAWTGTSGSPTVQNSPIHHGSNAARIPLNSRVYKVFADQDLVYARAYVRWTSNPSSGNQAWLFNLGNADGSGTLVYVRIVNDAGIMKWGIITKNSAGNFTYDLFTGPTPTINTWYCIELKWQKNTANGAKIIVNGAFVGQTTATTHNSQADTLNLWLEQTEITAFYDCVVVSDDYVGSEDNLEVGNNLTVANKITIKTPESGDYIDIWNQLYQDPSQPSVYNPILEISQGVKVNKDFLAYGYLGSYTNPDSPTHSGGGAIMIGHGFENQQDPPRINMTDSGQDTLCLTAGSTMQGETYIGVDPVLANMKLKDLMSYGVLVTTSAPGKGYGGGALLMGHGLTGSTDPPKICLVDSVSGYDTLNMKKVDGVTPANLDLGTLIVHDNIYSDLDKKLCFVGDSNGSPGTNLGFIDFKDTHFSGDRILDFKGTYHTDEKYQWHWNFWDGSDWYLKAALTEDGQFKLPVNGSGGGLKIGDDVHLYRSAENVLYTPDSLAIGAAASVSSAGDAIFNSVKGTSSAAALKAGTSDVTEFAVSWDNDNVYLTSFYKHLCLFAPGGKDIKIQRNLVLESGFYQNYLGIFNESGVPVFRDLTQGDSWWIAFDTGATPQIRFNNSSTALVGGEQPYLKFYNASNSTNRYIYNWANRIAITFPDSACEMLTIEPSIGTTAIGLHRNGSAWLYGPLTITDFSKWLAFRNGATRLFSNADGVLQVQDGNGALATIDASMIFVDHMNSASGQGILVYPPLKIGNTNPWYFEASNGSGQDGNLILRGAWDTFDIYLDTDNTSDNHFKIWRDALPSGSPSLMFSVSGSGDVILRGGYLNINPYSGSATLNLQINNSTKGYFGSDGYHSYIVSNVGALIFHAATADGQGLHWVTPYTNNNHCLGSSISYWNRIYTNILLYMNLDQYPWDEYDDLQLIRELKTVEDEKGKRWFDAESTIKLFRHEDTQFFDVGKVTAFSLSGMKKILEKVDAQEAEIGALVLRVEALEQKLKEEGIAG